MIKCIDYSVSGSFTNARRKGNWLVGESTVGYGPTETTGFFNSVVPPEGGYTIYQYNGSLPGNLSYFSASSNSALISYVNSASGESYTTPFQAIDWINGQNNYFVDPNYFDFTAEIASAATFTLPIQSTNTPTINCLVDWGDGATGTITAWNSASKSHTYPSTGGGSTTVVYGPGSSGTLDSFSGNPSSTSFAISDFFEGSLPTVSVGNSVSIVSSSGTYVVTITSVFSSSSISMNVRCTGSTFLFANQVTSISVATSGPPTTYNIKIAGQISNLQFNGYQNLKEIKSWGCLNISLPNAFTNCQSMTCTAVDSPRITATNLTACFNSCGNFNGAIGNWDTSTVTNMNDMFNGAASFNQNIGNWVVSNVTDMGYMLGADAFNQDIGNWDVSKVTNMELMFQGPTVAFNQNIGRWNISQVANFGGFMQQKTTANFSTTNLDAIYNGWSSRSVQSNKSISFGTAKYTSAGAAGRAKLISTYGWTIVDGGQA